MMLKMEFPLREWFAPFHSHTPNASCSGIPVHATRHVVPFPYTKRVMSYTQHVAVLSVYSSTWLCYSVWSKTWLCYSVYSISWLCLCVHSKTWLWTACTTTGGCATECTERRDCALPFPCTQRVMLCHSRSRNASCCAIPVHANASCCAVPVNATRHAVPFPCTQLTSHS